MDVYWPACNYSVYHDNERSLKNITVSDLVQKLASYCICDGVSEITPAVIHHVIPCQTNYDQKIQESAIPMQTVTYQRLKECFVLHERNNDARKCANCLHFENVAKQKTIKTEN